MATWKKVTHNSAKCKQTATRFGIPGSRATVYAWQAKFLFSKKWDNLDFPTKRLSFQTGLLQKPQVQRVANWINPEVN